MGLGVGICGGENRLIKHKPDHEGGIGSPTQQCGFAETQPSLTVRLLLGLLDPMQPHAKLIVDCVQVSSPIRKKTTRSQQHWQTTELKF